MEKIKIYHDHGVKVFSGGDFAEAAIAPKKFDQYCQETKKWVTMPLKSAMA